MAAQRFIELREVTTSFIAILVLHPLRKAEYLSREREIVGRKLR
jgi:hypothetical protein